MNQVPPATFVPVLETELRAFAVVCEDLLALAARDHQALNGPGDYQAFEFFRSRKDLLARLDSSLNNLRKWRLAWQQSDPKERARYPQVKSLFQMLQDQIVKILQLDRENQQALLRRGLLPARHVPALAGQRAHCVADLYRRHAGR